MKKPHEPHKRLVSRLEELREVCARDPRSAARGRARFLNQAAEIREGVSRARSARPRVWNPIFRKERFAMNVILSLLVVFALAFGGTATVAAAQDDLPGDALYSVKTLYEDARLWVNADPQEELELLMYMIRTRTQEMAALQAQGMPVPQSVQLRLEKHIRQALQVAAGMPDDELPGALLQIRTALQEQERLMQQLQPAPDESMLQLRQMIESRMRLVDEGLNDPEGFRNTIQTEQEQQTGQDDAPQGSGGNGPDENPGPTEPAPGPGPQGPGSPGPNKP